MTARKRITPSGFFAFCTAISVMVLVTAEMWTGFGVASRWWAVPFGCMVLVVLGAAWEELH